MSREFEVWELDKAHVLKCIQLTDVLSAKIDEYIKKQSTYIFCAKSFRRFINSEKIQYVEIEGNKNFK